MHVLLLAHIQLLASSHLPRIKICEETIDFIGFSSHPRMVFFLASKKPMKSMVSSHPRIPSLRERRRRSARLLRAAFPSVKRARIINFLKNRYNSGNHPLAFIQNFQPRNYHAA